MEQFEIHDKVLKANTEEVKRLVAKGVDLNELDSLGNTPLHWAVMGGYIDIVEILLGAGADPNVLCSQGYTPKWSALDFELYDIAELLTSYGGKTNTGEGFDKASWTVFKNSIGQDLPKNEQ